VRCWLLPSVPHVRSVGSRWAGPDRWPTRDHIKPRSKGHRLAGNRAIVCAPCNTAKGSLSLERFANRLARGGDPRASLVDAFMQRLR
jgi:5-methylcytosine-specific restriction endonuclease McrA